MSYENDPHTGRAVGQYMGLEQREVGDWESGDIRVIASGPVWDHLRDRSGILHTGALLTMCDNAAGFTGGLAALPDGWVVSTNLHMRRFVTEVAGPVRIETALLRKGRNAVITAAEVFDDGLDSARIADCVLTSAVLVPAQGVPHWDRPAYLPPVHVADAAPLLEAFGIERPDPANHDRGVVLEVSDELRNPWGIVHGGVTATLVDVAAQDAALSIDHEAGPAADITLRYLAPAREGPLRARGSVVGKRSDGVVVTVEVVDVGNGDRTVATAATTIGTGR